MKHFMAIAVVAVLATCAWAEEAQLASVAAGESASGGWTAEAAFETAEYRWDATVEIEGPGTLTLCYPGDGRTALRAVEGPTEEPQSVSLHMRANPDTDGPPWTLPVHWRFEAGEEPAICRMRSGEGEPIPDGAAPRLTPLYQHPIPRAAEPPVIDGDLSDACWNDEAYIGDPYWRMYNAPRDAKMATYVWCAYDDENLYVAFRCETPDVGKLVANITERDGYAWRDDSAEIFFDLGHDHHTYYEYIVNPLGVVFDSKWFHEGGQWLTDWDYIGEWRTAVEPGAWIVEIRLALESYEKRDIRGNPTGEMPLPTGDVAGILFSRNDIVSGEGMSHADNTPSFHEVHQYGHLVGFRPNRVETYRRTALREIERLEGRWRGLDLAVGRALTKGLLPSAEGHAYDLPQRLAWLQEQMYGPLPKLAPALAELRERIEAPAPEFDEWVAIGDEIERLDDELDRARATLAPLIAQHRWPDSPWGIAIAPLSDGAPWPTQSATLRVPDQVELSAARGEVDGTQLVLLGDADPVRVQAAPLVGPGGTIPASAITWYSIDGERMIPLEPMRPWWKRDNAPSSFMPTGSGSSGRVYWQITIPRDAAPGLYRGEIVTTDGEHRVALPVELTVHDFTLPVSPSLAVSVALESQHIAQQWYGERSPLGAGEYWPYAEALLQHGVVPREILADFTRWSDDRVDFDPANRMVQRARPYQPAIRAMIAARPEQLNALGRPRATLARAVDHWEDVTDVHPMPTFVPPGVPVPEIGPRQSRATVAVAEPGMDLAPIEGLGAWAMAPEIAAGFGGCEGAALAAAAGAAEVSKAWRIRATPDPMHARMLGWLADDYRANRVFWDAPDDGALCASGLLYCQDEDGARRVEPHPTVTLKLLQQAVQDYEYLRIARALYRESGVLQPPNRLSRLRLATDTHYRRNWDMVMNIRDFNRDPDHLADRRAAMTDEIIRTRRMLRRLQPEGELPGDATP